MHVLMVVAAASSSMRSEETLAIETSAKLRRKQQNRNAYAMPILLKRALRYSNCVSSQKAFRRRKEARVRELEESIISHTSENSRLTLENSRMRSCLRSLINENMAIRTQQLSSYQRLDPSMRQEPLDFTELQTRVGIPSGLRGQDTGDVTACSTRLTEISLDARRLDEEEIDDALTRIIWDLMVLLFSTHTRNIKVSDIRERLLTIARQV
jgi:hypothetical protein